MVLFFVFDAVLRRALLRKTSYLYAYLHAIHPHTHTHTQVGEVIAKSDYILVAAALTPSTVGMVGAEELARVSAHTPRVSSLRKAT